MKDNKPDNKPIKVVVKPKHFRLAKDYQSIFECPLALALRDEAPNSRIIVGGHTVQIDYNLFKLSDNWKRFSLIEEMIVKAKAGKRIGAIPVMLTPYIVNGIVV